MELFSPEFFVALINIIIIDLVLAGDNAIVIGMAARNLPKHLQKKAIVWGTVGAVAIRTAATLAVVWLLKIPGLLLAGGVILLWIAYKLLTDEKDHKLEAKSSLAGAIGTILLADAVMGMDNVLAVAGAAHQSFLLVLIGLAISIPIVVWGSSLFVKLVNRFVWIIYLGAGVLAYTSAKMITDEPFLNPFFEQAALKWGLIVLLVVLVLGLGYRKSRAAAKQRVQSTSTATTTKVS